MSLLNELKRRNVIRVGIAYAVVAWLAIQITDVMIDNIGAPDWVFRTLLLVLAVGFPLVLILAWAFEMTPDGIKRDEDVDREQSIAPQTGRRLNVLIIAGLVLIVAWFVARDFYPGSSEVAQTAPVTAAEDRAEPAGPGAQSVAVLPFRAMSSGLDDEYFADGLTEEILNALAQLPELLVTARTSSFHFKGMDLPVPDIARQLGVAHVVEGSVRRDGERVRITAQLIRAGDGFHLWSQTYDDTLEDAFAVQEDIALNIAEALDLVLDEEKLGLMRRSGIGDVQAFIAFQKGREIHEQAHEDVAQIENRIGEATPYFDQALAASPQLLAARIYKADALAHRIMNIAGGSRDEQYPGEAEQSLLELQNDLDEAWENARPGNQRDILDVERSIFHEDWAGLRQKIDRAMRPGTCPRTNWTSEIAATLGSLAALKQKTEEQLACDPMSPMMVFTNAYVTLWNGEPQESIQRVDEARARGVRYFWLDGVEYMARLALGDSDPVNAAALLELQGSLGWWTLPPALVAAAASGDMELARELAEDFWNAPGTDDWSSVIAAAVIGDRQRANEFAARIDARPGGFMVLNNITFTCLCGSPFDLEATPNFARRIAEAGVVWSPRTIVNYPGKDW